MPAERAACRPYTASVRLGYQRGQRKTCLDAGDADADVGGLDHADVVDAVADGQEVRLLVLLDELDDERLLERGHAA